MNIGIRNAGADSLQGECINSWPLLVLLLGGAWTAYHEERISAMSGGRGGRPTWESLCTRLVLLWSPARRRRTAGGGGLGLGVVREGRVKGGPALAVLAGRRR